MRYDWNYMHGYDTWSWMFMLFMMTLVIVGIIWAIKSLSESSSGNKDTALDVLKKRLAAGEIDDKEFEQKKKLIRD